MRVPSGLNCASHTQLSCPAMVAMGLQVAVSHTRAVLSPEAVRMREPSGLNCADVKLIS